MPKIFKTGFFICCSFLLISSWVNAAQKEEVKEYPWFKESFLDLSEDLVEAKQNGRGLILYFHQEGCPYCKKLLNDNFSRPELVSKLTSQYDFIELNMWGDRSVIGFDGGELTEKTLAVKLRVMFTPTLVFINSNGKVEFRLNGYYSPHKFNTLLDYLASEKSLPFSQYYRQVVKSSKTEKKQIYDFVTTTDNYAYLYQKSNKPLLLILDEDNCKECKELYSNLSSSEGFKSLTQQFTITRLAINSDKTVTTLDNRQMSAKQWADELKVQYTPSLLFFESGQKKISETFRLASYVRKFHLESVLMYIADKKYIEYPEFQRYIHDRTTKLREKGIKFDLWK